MPDPPYEVKLEEKHWAQIAALPRESQQDRVTAFLMRYASHTPRLRMANGDLKELKGAYAGYWQYDIDRQYRLIYRIDEERKQVLVEYIGNHPDWGSGGKGRRIRS